MTQAFLRIRSNKPFEWLVITVIILSALMVGAKSYRIDANVLRLLYVLDWAVTFFFLFELIIRFLGEEKKSQFFKSGWNIFDTIIVAVSLIPISDSELALLGRLIRIFRVLRMISLIPQLRVLMNSLIKSLPQLGYVCLLMFIIFYIYAAIGTTFFEQINPDLWGDILVSMLTLFRVMTFEDWTDVMYETMVVYGWSWAFYLTFIFLTAFAFLNMTIGIVVKALDQEQEADAKKDEIEANAGEPEPDRYELMQEIRELRSLVETLVKEKEEQQDNSENYSGAKTASCL